MQDYLEIVDVKAREILDSRGNPTLEAQVTLADGSTGRAAVPSGASTGAFEAVELRDKEERYNGKGVSKAVQHVNVILAKTIRNEQAHHQAYIDSLMIQEDGTENKGKLGANAILGVSMATACAAARSFDMPLYQYLGGRNGKALPVPMSNILNGGAHTISAIDFQEFMIMPVGACCFKEGLRMVTEVYHKLKELLDKDGHITAIGDEGGFAPNLKDAFEVFDYLMKAVCEAGYEPGKDIVFAMDAAASELYNKEAGMYVFPGESMLLRSKMDEEEEARPDTEKFTVMRSTEEMIEYYKKLTSKYPLVSIEDGLDEEDWDGWVRLTKELGDHVQLVGDDLFVTNTKRLKKGISLGAANAILIKVNQIGSVTEALDAIEMAHRAGYATVISHRSGETEDTFIADLAVAVNAGQIKTGAPCRSDRVAKYNQLLRIEEELRSSARYDNPFEKFK